MISAVARREVALVSALLFASGFAGLVYQVLWMRELGLLFGNGSHAAAATLAAFFMGIASGGAFFGRRAAGWRRPLRGYGLLEAAVAASALLYFALLDLYHALYAPLFAALHGHPAGFVAAKFGLALCVLFPPAFFMGGTLPAMAQHLVRRSDSLGSTASLLYGVNTLGAAAGAYSAAFLLVRHLGVTGSYAVAVGTTVAVALCAMALGRSAAPAADRRNSASAPAPELRKAASAPAPLEPPLPRATLYALAALSGLTTLGLEVLWTRMFAQVLQNSVYTFAAILVTFLVALAMGAGIARWLARRPWPPVRVLAWLLLASGLLVAATPALFTARTSGLEYIAAESGFGEYVLRVFGGVAIVLLAPVAVLGSVFPYLLKVAEGWRWSAGRAVGDLTAANTASSVLGSLAAGFVLLEWWGLWASVRLAAAIYLAAALALAWRDGHRPAWALAAAALLAVGAGVGGVDLPQVRIDPERERVLEVLEGSAATIAVVQQPGSRRIKLNNYYGLGGSGDRTQEARQAHLPLLLHPAPRSVFFLGLGTGITAGAALQHPVERVVVAELVPEVVTASRRHFGPWLGGLFEDPRASIVAEDGRNLLAGSRESYDVIIADLFLPWKAGAGSLYSRELYEAGLERLAPGGIYGQWLALIQVSEREFDSIARTFASVFPRTTLWRGNFRTTHPLVLLVGERDPAPLDPAALAARIASVQRLEADRAAVGIGRSSIPADASELLLHYQGDLTRAASLLESAPINSDDRPFVEFSAPVTHRQKRVKQASAYRGTRLLDFYAAVFAETPPAGDPLLAAWPDAMRALPSAGLDLYRSRVKLRLGDREAAAEASARYREAWLAAQQDPEAAHASPGLREPSPSH